jgi:prolyl 4-hydroxylase
MTGEATVEAGAGSVEAMLEHLPGPAAAAEPPLCAPWLTVDGFLDPAEAQALRGHYDAHFANPHAHRPETHQSWNYWYVPQLYTYLRTSPEKIVPRALVESFHRNLSRWAAERLGMGHVTWPNLSLYVDGCVQHLHNDATNGRFGFVYSLTLDSRRSRGGETILLREGDLLRSNLSRAAAGPSLRELVEPRFNRLTVFDDRVPHGVERVEGSMDPLDGRIVLHGHISESAPIVRGPLAPATVADVVAALAARALDSVGRVAAHGPLCARLAIHADGSVGDVRLLVDRLVRADGGDARPLAETMLALLRDARFPAAAAASEAFVPIAFGGPLPWMRAQPDRIVSRLDRPVTAVAAARAPAQAAARPGPRAAIGASVRARLQATQGVARIPKDRLEAYVVPDFLDPAECEALIRLIDAGRIPSGLLAPSDDPEFRTSESCNLDPADPLVAELNRGIDALLGIESPHGEPVQGQRYAVGQQFKPHHDFFHTSEPYWPAMEQTGGQRTWTAMVFLNKPEAGGQTAFPKAGLRITPAAGYLLVWNNLDAAGEPNDFSLHQGLPVEAGVKYVLTKWYRERPWNPAGA